MRFIVNQALSYDGVPNMRYLDKTERCSTPPRQQRNTPHVDSLTVFET